MKLSQNGKFYLTDFYIIDILINMNKKKGGSIMRNLFTFSIANDRTYHENLESRIFRLPPVFLVPLRH